MYTAKAVQIMDGKNWRWSEWDCLQVAGLHALAGHQRRKIYAAIRSTVELAAVAFSGQDAILGSYMEEINELT
jgi:hypothetical protein